MTPVEVVRRLRNRADAFALDVIHLEGRAVPDSELQDRLRHSKTQGYRIAIAELRNLADEIERA